MKNEMTIKKSCFGHISLKSVQSKAVCVLVLVVINYKLLLRVHMPLGKKTHMTSRSMGMYLLAL